jgi:diguanylate cyclase (GGDEF)-like protein
MNHAETYKNNILVVDDSPDTLKVLSRILTWQGYIVRPVLNAEFALKTICENPPDLILLDIMLPGMSGYEFCQHLKTVEQTRDIPVVFMSALHESGDKVRAFQLGGVDYITKPFQVEEVLARVAMHLKLRNMHKQLQEQNMNLQQEIAERKRIEQALWQHNRDLSLFNEMSESLQMCRTEADTYEMIAKMCTRLFPADSGYIALIDEAHQMVSEVASWGEYPSSPRRVFPLEECKRLRHGEVSVIEDSDPEEWCVRLSQSIRQGQQCLCVPISTAEEMLGVFSLQISHDEPTITDPQQTRKSALQRMLVIRLVEHYALILINLRLREKLRLASIRDALTGLYNRRYMEEVLQQMVNHAKRHHTSLALIMLDIDHFKTFNDTYGHEAGDVVLQALGTMLQANFRDEDVACRYGGEEFLLILPDATVGSVQKRAEGLLLNVRSLQIPYQETTLQITISIGVAALPDHGFDIHRLVSAADTAMYQAKQCGRNQVVVASS